MNERHANPDVPKNAVIACGGTGGHLFPGIAVASELRARGCQVTLLVSAKAIDQQAAANLPGMAVLTLPAVGLSGGNFVAFVRGFCKSYSQSRRYFRQKPPSFVLGMGGFSSAPPLLAARRLGAGTWLHESNTIPGRANRLLARFVNGAFTYFEQTGALLRAPRIDCFGMPVRQEFLQPITRPAARAALGLKANGHVLLVMGGSQGAVKINQLVLDSIPQLRAALPALQFLHFTGAADLQKARATYAAHDCPATVLDFCHQMGLVLAAADATISRAGSSSLAELAARQLPAILIPYPFAAGNHQYHNARAFAQSGAAILAPENLTTPSLLTSQVVELLGNLDLHLAMRGALLRWHRPAAAATIAEQMLRWPAPAPPPGGQPAVGSTEMEALNA